MREELRQALEPVRAGEERRRHTLAFLEEKRARGSCRGWRYSVVAVSLLLCLGGYGVYSVPVSAVSVELESPVQLQLNCFDRVVSAQAYDPQGDQLLQDTDLTHCGWTEAVERLAQTAQAQGKVWVTVQADSPQQQQEMAGELAQSGGETAFVCDGATPEEWQAAQEAGLSVGRYRAWQQLLLKDPTITAQQVRSLPMSQLRRMLQEQEPPAAQAPETSPSAGTPGSGQGYGPGNGQGNGSGNGQGNGQGYGQGNGQGNGPGNGQQNRYGSGGPPQA